MNLEHLNKLLEVGVKNHTSDIHLKPGRAPLFRVNGDLKEIRAPKLTPEDTLKIVQGMLGNVANAPDLHAITEYDMSYALADVGRFRVNIFRQRGALEIIMRIIPIEIPSFAQLGLPPVMEKIASLPRGLILVTGITGSGKSSTLAAIIDHINTHRQEHILTLEDPIEFVHQDKRSSVSQREIGTDSHDFASALRGALRQDPDVILIGEMRDFETIDIALKAAETGHLVLSTVHTTDAARTIGRLVGVFPSNLQDSARIRIAENLKASISQRLLPRADGQGRVAAAEIMVTNLMVEECIRDAEKTPRIKDVISRGKQDVGSQTFDQHLSELYQKQLITLDTAKSAATNPADFERALAFE
jgi:twitching motility protein PilT